MSQSIPVGKRSSGCGCLITAIGVTLVVCLIGSWIVTGIIIDAARSNCQFYQSGIQQSNPLPRANPQTAADCVNTINIEVPLIRAAGLGFGAFLTLVLSGFMFGFYSILNRNTSPTST